MFEDTQLTKSLGWMSIGLGLLQLTMPRTFARLIGVGENANSEGLTRLLGVREFVCGINILTQERPIGWLWGRVAGDTMDLVLLGVALNTPSAQRERVFAATAATVGATLMDLYTALRRSWIST